MKKKVLLYFSLVFVSFFIGIPIYSQEEPSELKNKQTPSEWNFAQYRFGGYGEILFQRMDYGPNRYKDPAGAPKGLFPFVRYDMTSLPF